MHHSAVHQKEVQVDGHPAGGKGGYGQTAQKQNKKFQISKIFQFKSHIRKHKDAPPFLLRLPPLLLIGQFADQLTLSGDHPGNFHVDHQCDGKGQEVLREEDLHRQEEGKVKVDVRVAHRAPSEDATLQKVNN